MTSPGAPTTRCIIGATDLKSGDADDLPIPADQVQQMLDSGEAMIPGYKARAVRVGGCSSPHQGLSCGETDTVTWRGARHHRPQLTRDGVYGMLAIAELTACRLMAERSPTSC